MTEQQGRDHRPLNYEPAQTSGYLDKRYWDERFQEEEDYDWFKKFEEFSHLLLPSLQQSDKILMIGCGNSSLTFDLCKLGYQNITSIDLSEIVIAKMQSRAQQAGMHSLEWQVADMLYLPFQECSYDVVIEKGTMDVLFVDNDSPWQPKAEVVTRVHQMLSEVYRVLVSRGKFVSITFAQPHFRRPFLSHQNFNWSVDHKTFGETFHYFVYTMVKGKRPEDNDNSRMIEGPQGCPENTMHDHMDNEAFLLSMDV